MYPNTGDREIYTSKFQLLVVKREREKEDRESSYSYTYLHIGRYILGTVKEVGWRIHIPTYYSSFPLSWPRQRPLSRHFGLIEVARRRRLYNT